MDIKLKQIRIVMKGNFLKVAVFMMLTAFGSGANMVFAQQLVDEHEKHRLQFHFSPKQHWMNDPNGMVYYNGLYHFFYQHNPEGTTHGPMYWGHATTRDFLSWEEQPIALYPDSLGTIFSGSAVIDKDNTAGFGKNAMVAIFTHHNARIEEARTGLHQYQSIAYSNDEGKTWTKYEGNPILPNPGITDFRDPKVFWYEAGEKWIMSLATKDRITFYSSIDLKDWKKVSEFGSDQGGHGGVWECPDLFPLSYKGKTIWVLLVSINPGGPNGGSATQYFTGDFDGIKFTANSKAEKWLDYGTDNYAGVTWSNTGERKVFIGWMSNWQYANQVPTSKWRGAATIARDLYLDNIGGEYYVRSVPVKELDKALKPVFEKASLKSDNRIDLSTYTRTLKGRFKLDLTFDTQSSLEIVLSNKIGQKLLVGYDDKSNSYYIDRTNSGASDFESGFARRHIAPRIASSGKGKLSLILDVASAELFADDGLTVMTDIFFPDGLIDGVVILGNKKMHLADVNISAIPSTWRSNGKL